MNLIIDVGNTNVKVAVYKGNTILTSWVIKKMSLLKKINKIFEKFAITKGIIASVAEIPKKTIEEINKKCLMLQVSSKTKVPFNNLYATPTTLGIDRIALVVAAVRKYPNKNVLIIDAGTCITYDFVNRKKEYLGGAISLGVEMRYESLHTFTANLPLLSPKIPKHVIGNSTENSIHSGVVNGVVLEIEGVIASYKEKFQDLTVVLTGGNTNFLSKQLKSGIFANQNFLLDGLNEILIYNTEE